MPYLLNLVYLLALVLFSPWLIYKAVTTGKYRRGFWTKLTGRVQLPRNASMNRKPRVWFHGVSVGEIHLLRQVIAAYRKRFPDHACVVSTTTDTGYDEATKCFADLPVFFWPFDFTWAVKAALRRVEPDLVVLAEGEVWPSFVRIASTRGVKVAVVNGRMSPRSARRYQKLAWLARGVFSRLDICTAQTEEYAEGFRLVGANNVILTGNVKYDGASANRRNARTENLRRLLAIGPDELVWIAGSTQDPEEEIVLGIYERARAEHPNLRLILVPRQKDRFDPVAELLARRGIPFVRRSELALPHHLLAASPPPPVILVDTFGELSAVWGLADVAFVGGSLDGKRGGQNMIEPAAYGAAVVFGPHTWNFKDAVKRLLDANAAVQAADAAGLEREMGRLLTLPLLRADMGDAARALVARQQGAVARTIDALAQLISENDHLSERYERRSVA